MDAELLLLEHPSVKHSHCEAVIGVMAVKKTSQGIYLFFCHNTDSFVSHEGDIPLRLISDNAIFRLQALASMTSEDKSPHCVMSRRSRQGTTAHGGRFSRFRR